MILFAATAFGQSVLTNEAQMLHVPDHPQHADRESMATEHSLVGGGSDTYTFAHGERPLWEFGPFSDPPTPLGDLARTARKQKMGAKKAEVVFEKQGS